MRGPFDPGDHGLVGHLHRGLQPACHIQHDPFLVRVARDGLEHQLPGNRIEECFHIEVDDPVLPETPFPAYPHGVHWRTPRSVAVRVVVEHLFRVWLQHEHRHCLRYPVDHVRDTQDPGPTFLGYLRRADRPREIAARRHAVPQFVEVVLHILSELLDRHAVDPGRSALTLHLQPRIPHQPLGDVVRLALQLRLTHAVPSLSVDHSRSPGRPHPFAPQPTAIRRRITATTGESASAPATVLSSLRILPLGVLPLASPHPTSLDAVPQYRSRLHMFRTGAWTGLMLPVCRTPPGQ